MEHLNGNVQQKLPPPSTKLNSNVYFLDHCLFCLRKLEKDVEVWNGSSDYGVPKFRISTPNENLQGEESLDMPLDDFLKAWRYLFASNINGQSTINRFTNQATAIFTRTPPMCMDCGKHMENISLVLNGITNVVNDLHRTIKDSGKNGIHAEERYEKFFKALIDAKVEVDSKQNTLNFLEEIGEGQNIVLLGLQGKISPFHSGGVQATPTNSCCNSFLPTQPGHWITKFDSNGATKGVPIMILLDTSDPNVRVVMPFESPIRQPPLASAKDISNEKDFTDNLQQDLGIFEASTMNTSCRIDEGYESQSAVLSLNNTNDFSSSDALYDVISSSPNLPIEPKKKVNASVPNGFKRSVFEGYQVCDICKEYVLYDKMQRHMWAHVGDFLVKCPNPICPQIFSSRNAYYYSHLRLKKCGKDRQEYVKSCESCDFSTTHLMSLRTHLHENHENTEKSHSCPIASCTEKFSVRQSVEQHIALHHTSWLLKDSRKKGLSSSLESSKPTKTTKRSEKKNKFVNIQCKICEANFTSANSRKRYIKHLKIHTKEGLKVDCDLCQDKKDPAQFLQHDQLLRHYFAFHQIDTDSRCVCPICDKTYYNYRQFLCHLRNHKAKKKTVEDAEQVEGHATQAVTGKEKADEQTQVENSGMESVELVPAVNLDVLCVSPFKESAVQFEARKAPDGAVHDVPTAQFNGGMQPLELDLKKPERENVPLEHADGQLEAQFPNKSSSLELIRDEITTTHFQMKPLEQGLEPVVLTNPGVQEQHGNGSSFQPKEKPFSSSDEDSQDPDQVLIISKVISIGNTIRDTHLPVNNTMIDKRESTPPLCDQCGKQFNDVWKLRIHVKSVHQKKRLECSECGAFLPSVQRLQEHKLIHTGELPHQCPYCERRFRVKRSLTLHKRVHQEKERITKETKLNLKLTKIAQQTDGGK